MLPIATALRRSLSDRYTLARLRSDAFAGLVVGIVAVPLSMALAIAVGASPQAGLYTAAIAGAVAAIAGGSKFQVTGPTAAFIVILAPITTRFGIEGLLLAGLMAGVMLVLMGVARLGQLIQFIPHPVTTGFTTGIATVIGVLQLKDALGLRPSGHAEGFVERVTELIAARSTLSLSELGVAAITLALLLLWPRVSTRVPAPLVALAIVTAGVYVLHLLWPAFTVATINSRFQSVVDGVVTQGIPPRPPSLILPWGDAISIGRVRELFLPALSIAILGAIESLLSAVVADGMTGKKHDPNAELVGQGLANVVAPFFGGIAATGALARTATNVRAGATSPVAAFVHAAFVFVSIVALAPLVSLVPMAALASLLLIVAWRMSEVRHFVHILRVAPRSDVIVLVTCYALTVLMDMVVAITVGIVLAALLFMRRMSELTGARMVTTDEESTWEAPPGVVLYEINGPLFFGAAQRATAALGTVSASTRVIIIDLARVGVIDATGFVALESALSVMNKHDKFVILSGPLPKPDSIFRRADLERHMPNLIIAESRSQALQVATDLSLLNPDWKNPVPSTRATA